MSEEGLRRAWQLSRDNRDCLAVLAQGGYWRVAEAADETELRPFSDYSDAVYRIIRLRARPIPGSARGLIVEACYEGMIEGGSSSNWVEVARGEME